MHAAAPHPPFSFPRKKTGGVTVQKKGVGLAVSGSNDLYASGMKMIARGVAALALLDDLAYFYYPLLRSRWRLCCLTDAVHPLRVPLCPACRSAD